MDALALEREGDMWRPGPLALGPFGTMHGGAISGAIATSLEMRAAALGLGPALSATMHFLRPLKLEPFRIDIEIVQQGRRIGVLDGRLFVGDRLSAIARLVFLHAQPTPGLNGPSASPDLTALQDVMQPKRVQRAWFGDCWDWRRSADGKAWLRPRDTLASLPTPMARLLAAADWATGIFRADGWASPKVSAFPNADLHLSLWRPLAGDWIGLAGQSLWGGEGRGTTGTELHDMAGPLGFATQLVATQPLEGPPGG